MPSVSKKQAKFMRAVAHSSEFSKEVGVSQEVGKDFEAADQAKATKRKSLTKMREDRYGKPETK